MDPLEKLTHVGFTKVGRWSLKSGKPCCSLDELAGATDVLTANQAVDIYVFRDPEPKLFAGIPINLAAGLKDGLILEFRPPWNKAGL